MIDLKPIFEHSQAIKYLFESQGWGFLEERLKSELETINGKIDGLMTMNRPLTPDDIPHLNELRAHRKDLELFLGLKVEALESVSPEVKSQDSI